MTRTPSQYVSHSLSNRVGSTATEMALVLPVLLTLAIGAVDFARAYTTYNALSNAVRVGAESAATHRLTDLTSESWENRIHTSIQHELQDTPQINMSQLSVEIDWYSTEADRLRITVSAQVTFQTLVDWPGLPHQFPVAHAVSMDEYR